MRDLYLGVADALGLPAGRDARRAPSTSTASGAGCRSTTACREAVGEVVTIDTDARHAAQEYAAKHDVAVDPAWDKEKVFLELLGELVEPGLLQPTFLCDYPASRSRWPGRTAAQPGLIEAWDLIIGGVERGTGFSELVDPVVQREVLTAQSVKAAGGDDEAMQLDEDFLRALEYGAPPMGGLGLGVDRLVMLFTDANIRETILFPPPQAGG